MFDFDIVKKKILEPLPWVFQQKSSPTLLCSLVIGLCPGQGCLTGSFQTNPPVLGVICDSVNLIFL